MTEEWRSIDWATNYEVSSFGRVRSLDHVAVRSNGRIVPWKGRVLKPGSHERGYQFVFVTRSDGKRVKRTIHSLVAEFFIGPRPDKHDVAHWDGNPKNNHVSNLRYATRKENQADRYRHGTDGAGEKHSQAKLNNEQVRIIRSRLTQKDAVSSIARDFGVDPKTIRDIANGKTWKAQENV